MGEKSRRRREAFEGREVRPRVIGNGVKSERRASVPASITFWLTAEPGASVAGPIYVQL